MSVIYILFQDIGWDTGSKFMAAYRDIPDKIEIENQTFSVLTVDEYQQLYNGCVIEKGGGFIELQQYTLK